MAAICLTTLMPFGLMAFNHFAGALFYPLHFLQLPPAPSRGWHPRIAWGPPLPLSRPSFPLWVKCGFERTGDAGTPPLSCRMGHLESHERLMFVCLQKDAKQCCDVSNLDCTHCYGLWLMTGKNEHNWALWLRNIVWSIFVGKQASNIMRLICLINACDK